MPVKVHASVLTFYYVYSPLPPAVMSTQDDQLIVMKCLTHGAIDYLVKPLRQNELRHLWMRVWWWQQVRSGALVAECASRARA